MFRGIARGFLITATLMAGNAQAAWPERTVTIVTPFAAGGIADVVARLTAERLQSTLKQNFIVENQTGAGGTAAPERVARATPDGYTLMSTPIFQLTTAKYAHNVSFDENKDFKPISAVEPRSRSGCRDVSRSRRRSPAPSRRCRACSTSSSFKFPHFARNAALCRSRGFEPCG